MSCWVGIILSSAVVSSWHNKPHSLETERNPPKTECGCLHGGVIENGRTRNPLLYTCRGVGAHTGWPPECSAEDRYNNNNNKNAQSAVSVIPWQNPHAAMGHRICSGRLTACRHKRRPSSFWGPPARGRGCSNLPHPTCGIMNEWCCELFSPFLLYVVKRMGHMWMSNMQT